MDKRISWAIVALTFMGSSPSYAADAVSRSALASYMQEKMAAQKKSFIKGWSEKLNHAEDIARKRAAKAHPAMSK